MFFSCNSKSPRAPRAELEVKHKRPKKVVLRVDISENSGMLFSVMRIDQEISELAQVKLEEVFDADPRALAEYEAQCDIWRDKAIAAQEEEMSE